jgi:hypothetical protein
MRLAEALSLRADRKRTFEQLRTRAQASARYQEGEEPAEAAVSLLAAASAALDELEVLIAQINATNSTTTLADGRTLTAALAERDVLALRHSLVSSVADAGAGSGGRGGLTQRQLRSELRSLSAVPVPQLRAQADDLAQRLRALDAEIQQANRNVELVTGHRASSSTRC